MHVRSSSVSVLALLLVTCCPLGGATISDDGSSAVNELRNGDGGTDPWNYTLLSALLSLTPSVGFTYTRGPAH